MLLLHLDNAIIHSQMELPPSRFNFTVCPIISDHVVNLYVVKRPGVAVFLCLVARTFEVIIFTTGCRNTPPSRALPPRSKR